MSRYTVHLRGLPWSAKEDDIRDFFRGLKIDDDYSDRANPAIRLIYLKNGKVSGEAEVRFATERDYRGALSRNKDHMGSRYIEVFEMNELRASNERTTRAGDDSPEVAFTEPIVRLRGLPFSCNKRDIESFFHGLAIAPNGITLASEFGAKRSGEAFVQFSNMDSAYRALDRHKREIGHRYIEVFKSSIDEAKNFIFGGLLNSFKSIYGATTSGSDVPNLNEVITDASNSYESQVPTRSHEEPRNDYPPPKKRKFEEQKYDSSLKKSRSETSYIGTPGVPMSSASSDVIRMRGLPFNTHMDDIYHFFQPLRPLDVQIKVNPRDRRPTGEAEVTFATYDDTMRALEYDRKHMNSRYIELFHDIGRRSGPHSPPSTPPHPHRYDERRELSDSKPFSSGYQIQKPYFKAPVFPSNEYSSKAFPTGFKSELNRYPVRSMSPPAQQIIPAPPRPPIPSRTPVPPRALMSSRPPSPTKLTINTSSQIYPPYQSKFFNPNQMPPNDFASFQNNYTPFGVLNRSAPVPPSAPPVQNSKPNMSHLTSNPYTSFAAHSTPPPLAPTAPYQSFHNQNVNYQSSMSQSKFSN